MGGVSSAAPGEEAGDELTELNSCSMASSTSLIQASTPALRAPPTTHNFMVVRRRPQGAMDEKNQFLGYEELRMDSMEKIHR
jgi:hypothetical protein